MVTARYGCRAITDFIWKSCRVRGEPISLIRGPRDATLTLTRDRKLVIDMVSTLFGTYKGANPGTARNVVNAGALRFKSKEPVIQPMSFKLNVIRSKTFNKQ